MKLKKGLKFLRYKKTGLKRIIRRKKKKTPRNVLWKKDPYVRKDIIRLIASSGLNYNISDISVMRSYDSKARAYARIWGLSKIWQLAISHKPHYIIEVLSEKYDGLSRDKKDEVLLHELAHIPSNFSGSLLPHIRRGKRNFKNKVDRLMREARINNKYK